MWYVLIWVAPADPCKDAWFVHEGPYETREAAVVAAREAQTRAKDDRYVRVIFRAEAPTGAQWDEAEDIAPASPE
jgi:hypothetical protein